MSMEPVKGEDYGVEYIEQLGTVVFQGTVRLQSSEEYAPILALLQGALAAHGEGAALSLDFKGLNFLNSSGINMLSKFVIGARKEDRVQLTILGSQDIYWQQKSLLNLQKLWPKVKIEIS